MTEQPEERRYREAEVAFAYTVRRKDNGDVLATGLHAVHFLADPGTGVDVEMEVVGLSRPEMGTDVVWKMGRQIPYKTGQ